MTQTSHDEGALVLLNERVYDDVIVQGTVTIRETTGLPSNAGARIVLRYSDSGTYYALFLNANNTAQLRYYDGQNWRRIGPLVRAGVRPGEPVTFRVEVIGSEVKLYIDGDEVVHAIDIDSLASAGKVGFKIRCRDRSFRGCLRAERWGRRHSAHHVPAAGV